MPAANIKIQSKLKNAFGRLVCQGSVPSLWTKAHHPAGGIVQQPWLSLAPGVVYTEAGVL